MGLSIVLDSIPVFPGVGHRFGHAFLSFLFAVGGHQRAPQTRRGVPRELGERVDGRADVRHGPLGLFTHKPFGEGPCDNRIGRRVPRGRAVGRRVQTRQRAPEGPLPSATEG